MPAWEIALAVAGVSWLALLLYARWRGVGRNQHERPPGIDLPKRPRP